MPLSWGESICIASFNAIHYFLRTLRTGSEAVVADLEFDKDIVPMKAKLIVVGGTTSANEVDLDLPTIIGRGRSADVTIPHSLVSRQHCKITERDGRLVVKDLKSLNGTYVGDERITEVVLEPGSLLTVGTVTFRALYEVGNQQEAARVKSSPHLASGIPDFRRASPDVETVPLESGGLEEMARKSNPPAPHLKSASEAAERDTSRLADVVDASSQQSSSENSD